MKLKKLLLPCPMLLKCRTRLADHPHPVLALYEPSSLRSVFLLLDLTNSNPPPKRAILDRNKPRTEVAAGHAPILGSFEQSAKSNFERAKAFLTHLHLATM